MRELSGRASREPMPNLVFVRASIESLPAELTGIADLVTVVLPWGSLLSAVALPSVPALRNLRTVCQTGAKVTIVLGSDPARDQAELRRLGLSSLSVPDLASRAAAGYEDAGFRIERVRAMPATEVASLPSTWARRLARGEGRA